MKTILRIARLSGAVALLAAAAWLFLPSPLGGSATYVSTFGTSMEPGLTAGDLAILRPADDYRVGDVVAYESAGLGTTVMHRIVDGDAEGFLMQGDNNSWLDEEKPSSAEVMGRLWLHVPQGGKAIAALRSPSVLVLVAMAAVTVLLATRKPSGRHTPLRRREPRRPHVFSTPTRARARQVTLGSGVVTLLAAVGGGALLLMPETQTDSRAVQVIQQGRFSYAGAAVPGTTYPSGRIETGDPVWTKLADDLTVSFQDVVTGADALEGTVRLDVAVTTPDGWSAVLTSGPAAALREGTATASVPLDPTAASGLIGRHYEEIGAVAGAGTLTVVPVVEAAGTVAGRPFTAGSPAGLAFTLDSTALRLAGDATAALMPATENAVTVEETVPGAFTLGSVTVPIDLARIVAGAVLAVALVMLAASLWISRPVSGSAVDQLLARHAGRLLPVSSFTSGSTIVDVADAEALSRVAERLDSLVLHHEGPRGSTFAVRDGDTTYRYVIRSTTAQRATTLHPMPTILGRLA
jgi:signal peptidase I